MKKLFLLFLMLSLNTFSTETYMSPNPDSFYKKQKNILKGVGSGLCAFLSLTGLIAIGSECIKINDKSSYKNFCSFSAAIAMTSAFLYGTYYLGKDLVKKNTKSETSTLIQQNSDNHLFKPQ